MKEKDEWLREWIMNEWMNERTSLIKLENEKSKNRFKMVINNKVNGIF